MHFPPFVTVLAVLGLSDLTLASAHYQSLGDLFQGELANLSADSPFGNPFLGGQDPYHCCLLAVNDSLEITNGSILFRPGQTTLVGTVDDFLANPFPCDAQFNGGNGYPAQVWVSYGWCNQNCPGWAMSWIDSYSLRLWLRPLVLFIIPSAIFSLNIPRRQRINVPRQLFPRTLGSTIEILALFYEVPLAVIIVTFDLIIWTMLVLTLSGPMILSGIYEALLDKRLLKYLKNRILLNRLTIRQRAQLLIVILFGSLDPDPTWVESIDLIKDLPNDNIIQRFPSALSAHITASKPSQHTSKNLKRKKSSVSSSGGRRQVPAEYEASEKANIDIIKTKLLAALECQMSFGSAAGAAVVFYAGNFAYTLIELQGNYGQVDLSHQLAFGMMWMTVPHVAIISCLLLACNNPFSWESTICASVSHVSLTRAEEPAQEPLLIQAVDQPVEGELPKKPSYFFWRAVYTPYYGSRYKSAWIWNRGQCKRSWILRFANEHPQLAPHIEKEVLGYSFHSLFFSTTLPAVFLVAAPCFLGAMVSYTTPAVGLGCRSLTLLTYTCAQCLLILLWLLGWVFWESDSFIDKGTQDPGGISSISLKRILVLCASVAWYIAFSIGLLASFFTGVMGTVFILMSLYSNCLCATPAKYWLSRWNNPDAVFYLGLVSTEQVWNAENYWIPTGIAAVCFLIVMTYLGWWYSRRMRGQFKDCTREMDGIDEEDWAERDNDQV